MEFLLFGILYRGLNYEKMRTTKHIRSKQIIELRKHMALLKMVLHLVNAIYYKLGNDYCKTIENKIMSIIKNDPKYAVKYYHPLLMIMLIWNHWNQKCLKLTAAYAMLMMLSAR